jgi:hypothetical protein
MDVVCTSDVRCEAREKRGNFAAQIKIMGPSEAYFERGCDITSDESQGILVHIGAPSRCKLIGERLGGSEAAAWWAGWEASDPARLAALGARVLEAVPRDAPNSRRAQAARYLNAGRDRCLLVPGGSRWGILPALARHFGELHRNVRGAANAEEYWRHMGRCWAW